MIVAGPATDRVRFKKETAKRLAGEWKELREKNPALYSIVSHLAGYCGLTLSRSIVVTQILRTDEEQKEIYGPNCTKVSPHQNWCAVDLRCRDFSVSEQKRLENPLRIYDQMNKFRHLPSASRTVWIHTVPNGGIHFHIQFCGGDRELPSFFQLNDPGASALA